MDIPTVLIVDDEADARASLLEFLKYRFNCKFAEARTGSEAVRFVANNPCDIIILDIKMPGKSGITVIKEAKDLNPCIDILVLSGWISDDVADEAVILGATDYAVKPIDLNVVNLKFSAILERRGQKINKT
ncbi:MAG: response regulator [Candidatus Omnitrophota bacterium]|jgi:YesN/AraC family two-component response regulator